jgi:hypothetical protein
VPIEFHDLTFCYEVSHAGINPGCEIRQCKQCARAESGQIPLRSASVRARLAQTDDSACATFYRNDESARTMARGHQFVHCDILPPWANRLNRLIPNSRIGL